MYARTMPAMFAFMCTALLSRQAAHNRAEGDRREATRSPVCPWLATPSCLAEAVGKWFRRRKLVWPCAQIKTQWMAGLA